MCKILIFALMKLLELLEGDALSCETKQSWREEMHFIIPGWIWSLLTGLNQEMD
jgi:hypothetical protein